VNFIKNFFKSILFLFGKAFYYSFIVTLLILQVACGRGVSLTRAEDQAKRAKSSLSYGRSVNKIVASKTGKIFY